MLDHFAKRSLDVSNQLNNLRKFSSQNVMKNKAVFEQAVNTTYFTSDGSNYPLDHEPFIPIQFADAVETEPAEGSGKSISRENLTYSMSLDENGVERYLEDYPDDLLPWMKKMTMFRKIWQR